MAVSRDSCGFHGWGCRIHAHLSFFMTLIWQILNCCNHNFSSDFSSNHYVFTIQYWLKVLKEYKQTWRQKHVSFSLPFIITYKEFCFCYWHYVDKPLSWVTKLCAPKFDKTISNLFWHSPWKWMIPKNLFS